MSGARRAIAVISLPPILNLLYSTAIYYLTRSQLAASPDTRLFTVHLVRNIYTYGFTWSLFEAAALALALRQMGAGWLREKYRRGSLRRDAGLAALLAAVTFAVLFAWQAVNAYTYGGWARYSEFWRSVVEGIPAWSKLYLLLVAPFAAGFMEEILWRGYGVDALEPSLGRGKALIVQAAAFGLMHGPTAYALVAAAIGYLYGLAYFKAGRRLLPLTAAHVLVDVVGFWLSFA